MKNQHEQASAVLSLAASSPIGEARKVADLYTVDGEIIKTGKFSSFKLVAQSAFGVKTDIVNVYSRNGRCIGYVHEADVDDFMAGNGKVMTPEGYWPVKWSRQLIELFDLHNTATYTIASIDDVSPRKLVHNNGFPDRVRFNWGFHDGSADAERTAVRDMDTNPDKMYANGYVRGVLAWENLGYRPESSDDAWNAFNQVSHQTERKVSQEEAMSRHYVIRSLSEGDEDLDGKVGAFWSNEDGWGHFETATRFTTAERMNSFLPISAVGDSEWMLYEEALNLTRKVSKTLGDGKVFPAATRNLEAEVTALLREAGWASTRHGQAADNFGHYIGKFGDLTGNFIGLWHIEKHDGCVARYPVTLTASEIASAVTACVGRKLPDGHLDAATPGKAANH